MTLKSRMHTAMAVVCVSLAALSSPVHAAEIAIVNGEHWKDSSEGVKKAYLVGLANMVQVQSAYHARNPPPDAQSFVPRWAKGMQGQTLDSVREGVDRWYAANPTKLQRPVIDIIWLEMAVPGLQKNK